MTLDHSEKMSLLHKAADVVIQAASSGKYANEMLVSMLEQIYDKMTALAVKD